MNMHTYWWPLIAVNEVTKHKPIRRVLLEVPLVIFRNSEGKVSALRDRCPHRHVALSEGRVVNGCIQCPYHGWQFDGTGMCKKVPGTYLPAQTKPLAEAFAVQELAGLVWVCLAPDATTPPPRLPSPTGSRSFSFIIPAYLETTLADAAENLLDGFHTHFVHPGLVRLDNKRQKVKARVFAVQDGVEAIYQGEELKSGLLPRLFEGDRSHSNGRFLLPGMAEIEIFSTRGLSLQITAYMTPAEKGHLNIQTIASTRYSRIPQPIKQLVLRRILAPVLKQDIDVLERQSRNRKQHPAADYLNAPTDLLGPHIRELLRDGKLSKEVDQEIVLDI